MWLLLILYVYLVIHVQYVSSFQYVSPGKRAGAKLQQSSSEEDDFHSRAPFLKAMIEAMPVIKERYFFPGHAGGLFAPSELVKVMGEQVFRFDLPELDELDNIHAPEGPLVESLSLTAKLFGAGKSWYLVNGSTSGILTAILSLVRRFKAKSGNIGKVPRLLIGRDSHKAVFDGLRIADAGAIILPCDTDQDFDVSLGISTHDLQQIIEENQDSICGFVITRPSYQGLMTTPDQLKSAIHLCHQFDIPVLVDEAHGAHLKFLSVNGLDALSCGADIVVQSAHKTLNSITQTAIMHVGNRIYENEPEFANVVHATFSSLTSTSPNAFLLASLDATQADFSRSGEEKVQRTEIAMSKMRDSIRLKCPSIGLLEDSAAVRKKGLVMDPLRLSLQFKNEEKGIHDSTAMDDLMCEEQGIYCELNLEKCLSYIIGAGRDEVSLRALCNALEDINYKIAQLPSKASDSLDSHPKQEVVGDNKKLDDQVVSYLNHENSYISKSLHRRRLLSSTDASVDMSLLGSTCAETIMVYPPGIPVIIRGETIQSSHLKVLNELRQALQKESSSSILASGCTVTGCSDSSLESIQVFGQ